MRFEDKFKWPKRSKKLLRHGSKEQKKGIVIASVVIKGLNLNPEKLLLAGNFTHTKLITDKIQLLLPTKPNNLLRQAVAAMKKLGIMGITDLEAVRNLHSIELLFKYKGWKFIIRFDIKSQDAPKHAWVRDFLLNEMSHEHIAKITSFVAAGIKSDSAFKEILQAWIPDNAVIQRLVEFQLQDIIDKPLVKIVVKKGEVTEYLHENGIWVKK